MHNSIEQLEITVLVLAALVVAFGVLARRWHTPYAILLVIGGLLLSLVPTTPEIKLNPAIVFFGFLPPLLFSAAYNTSWRSFQRNLPSIFLLAFGLVAFTTVGVALFVHWLIPGLDWRLGLVLGAVLSPTDAVAATSIARRVGLPRRVTDILEGESLVNDASGLLALQFATAIVVSGATPTISEGIVKLLYMVTSGIVVGLAFGGIVHWLEHLIDDAPVEITITLVVPFAAYLAAEALHSSGVLATVACGLYLGRQTGHAMSSRSRIDASAVWNTLDFLLNGLVFILIGLQLRGIMNGIRTESHRQLLIDAGLLCAGLILLRLIWEFPGAYLSFAIRRKLGQQEKAPPPRQVFIIGWTGMRGVVALAAAFALPQTIANGQPFPQRNLILFLTFSVILVTLVLQGLTLPKLIQWLGLAGNRNREEEMQARKAMLESVLAYIGEQRERKPQLVDVYDEFTRRYERRLQRLGRDRRPKDKLDPQHVFREFGLKLRRIERESIREMRDRGEIDDNVLRTLEREIDLLDARYVDASD